MITPSPYKSVTFPKPVSVIAGLTKASISSNVPSSKRISIRSRAVNFPLACCFLTDSGHSAPEIIFHAREICKISSVYIHKNQVWINFYPNKTNYSFLMRASNKNSILTSKILTKVNLFPLANVTIKLIFRIFMQTNI